MTLLYVILAFVINGVAISTLYDKDTVNSIKMQWLLVVNTALIALVAFN